MTASTITARAGPVSDRRLPLCAAIPRLAVEPFRRWRPGGGPVPVDKLTGGSSPWSGAGPEGRPRYLVGDPTVRTGDGTGTGTGGARHPGHVRHSQAPPGSTPAWPG